MVISNSSSTGIGWPEMGIRQKNVLGIAIENINCEVGTEAYGSSFSKHITISVYVEKAH